MVIMLTWILEESYNAFKAIFFYLFIFLVGLEFELRASQLHNRHSTMKATFCSGYFAYRFSQIAWAGLNQQSSWSQPPK
jgi:hypothetical protein